MNDSIFPDFVRRLPRADLPISGLQGWILQSDDGQLLFLEAQDEVHLPEHSHCDQWGFVVNGTIELTIGGKTRTYKKGDSYYIPAGTLHGGVLHPGFKAVDFFSDRDRYKTIRSGPSSP